MGEETVNHTLRLLSKAKYSFYTALVFYLFANPETQKVVSMIINAVAPFEMMAGDAITPWGLLVQTLLFFMVILGLMLLPQGML